MTSVNQFCYYSKPIQFLLYVNFKSGKRYVNCDIYNDIHDILTTIKSKILMKMNEFDMETTTFEQLDVKTLLTKEQTLEHAIWMAKMKGIMPPLF